MLENVSIIIPVAPHEDSHRSLLRDLEQCAAEIIVVSEGSRAKSLNAGVTRSTRSFLWFLHADSLIDFEVLKALEDAIEKKPEALFYFDLKFYDAQFERLNAWAANLRARWFDLPYGDQGLCVSKAVFVRIGHYPEDIQYGEDVIFVRLAKKAGVDFQRIAIPLKTSARSYKKHGWITLTLMHQWRIFKLLTRTL